MSLLAPAVSIPEKFDGVFAPEGTDPNDTAVVCEGVAGPNSDLLCQMGPLLPQAIDTLRTAAPHVEHPHRLIFAMFPQTQRFSGPEERLPLKFLADLRAASHWNEMQLANQDYPQEARVYAGDSLGTLTAAVINGGLSTRVALSQLAMIGRGMGNFQEGQEEPLGSMVFSTGGSLEESEAFQKAMGHYRNLGVHVGDRLAPNQCVLFGPAAALKQLEADAKKLSGVRCKVTSVGTFAHYPPAEAEFSGDDRIQTFARQFEPHDERVHLPNTPGLKRLRTVRDYETEVGTQVFGETSFEGLMQRVAGEGCDTVVAVGTNGYVRKAIPRYVRRGWFRSDVEMEVHSPFADI